MIKTEYLSVLIISTALGFMLLRLSQKFPGSGLSGQVRTWLSLLTGLENAGSGQRCNRRFRVKDCLALALQQLFYKFLGLCQAPSLGTALFGLDLSYHFGFHLVFFDVFIC